MKTLKAASAIFCMAATATFFSPSAHAQRTVYNKKTTFTFSAPVEIPGVHLKGYAVLPAGTYIFKLMDSQSNRHIVQIQSEDQKTTYATILAIPNVRMKPTGDTVLTFRELPAGEPPALRAWFYPGETWGDEFVYPKKRAKELAMANSTPVLYNEQTETETNDTVSTTSQAEMNTSPVKAYNQTGDEVELDQAVTAPEPLPEAAPMVAQDTQPATMPTTTPAPAPAPAPMAAPAELPHTAGDSTIYMLGGLLALAGAFGLRMVLQRAL